MSQVHAQARTTPRIRAEIKASSETVAELAERYNISRGTARKWKHRDSPEDRSHRPHTLHTTLLPVCSVPCDHILRRSWAYFQAREIMHGVLESFKQEAST